MKNPVFFYSKSGNQYFYDIIRNKIHYCNNTLKHIIENKGCISNANVTKNADDLDLYNQEYNLRIYNGLLANGFFKNEKFVDNSVMISKEVVKGVMHNVNQITFEVTEKCNLNCTYCGYSDMYTDHVKRDNKDMSIEMAKALIDYVSEYWNSPESRSHNSKVYISFYGGEPLVRFDFVKDIVNYVRSLRVQRQIQFSMTTNAVLLDKYMDYLVENNFNVLISLDGNETNNGYRLFLNGNNSFQKVYNNLFLLKKKYPEFFEKHINFNSVLHNKNNVTDVFDFISQNFGKTPRISEIRDTGISSDYKDDYNNMFKSVSQDLDRSIKKEAITKGSFIKLPSIEALGIFLHQYGGYNYNDYSDIKEKNEVIIKQPTGTCLPFSKKIFITVNGLLLPCETIDHNYYLGKVINNKVDLDFKKIADYYTSIFKKLMKRCESCYINKACQMCIYTMDKNTKGNFTCPTYMGYSKFQEYLSQQISKIEDSPYLYKKIMQKVNVE